VRGNPAAGILLLIAGLVGFLALVSGNLDRWIGKATGATPGQGSVFGLSGPSSQAALSGGTGSSSSAAANPGFGLGTRLGAPGGSHLQ